MRPAEPLAVRLARGKPNSLGETEAIVAEMLAGQPDLDELFGCLFDDDQWVRMRAGDALEKICRVQPSWLEPYAPRLLTDVAAIRQASIQWHLAQMFAEMTLTPPQLDRATGILRRNLSDPDVDWIVAGNSMTTLTAFADRGLIGNDEVVPLLRRQQTHRSAAVRKRAGRLLAQLGAAD